MEFESPAALLRTIVQLRAEAAPQMNDVEQLREARRERNRRIIDLAQHVVAVTHDQPDQQQAFSLAVEHLMEACRQLAMQGDAEHLDAMFDHAESLYQKYPESQAAADAGFLLASFAHENARQFADRDPRWLVEFARQARLFATRFPRERQRAAPLLFSAAWSCELHDMLDEAVACYTLVRERFPDSSQAEQAVAVLRRLHLPGTRPQFAGPTIDGRFISLDDFRGHLLLVVFWDTGNEQFQQDLPLLKELSAEYQTAGLRIVGVNLNEDLGEAESFLKRHNTDWPQIFYAESDKRRWQNPLVKFYGVRDIPQYWLIDRDGRVLDTAAAPERLEALVRGLLGIDNEDS
jgi:peroxiredoxin